MLLKAVVGSEIITTMPNFALFVQAAASAALNKYDHRSSGWQPNGKWDLHPTIDRVWATETAGGPGAGENMVKDGQAADHVVYPASDLGHYLASQPPPPNIHSRC
jgi:hypothetical protein